MTLIKAILHPMTTANLIPNRSEERSEFLTAIEEENSVSFKTQLIVVSDFFQRKVRNYFKQNIFVLINFLLWDWEPVRRLRLPRQTEELP